MQTDSAKIQALLDTRTPENIDLAFMLMESSGTSIPLPNRREVADWILAIATSQIDDDSEWEQKINILVDDSPLSATQIKQALVQMAESTFVQLAYSRIPMLLPSFLRWTNNIEEIRYYSKYTGINYQNIQLQHTEYLVGLKELKKVEIYGDFVLDGFAADARQVLKHLSLFNLKSTTIFPAENQTWEQLETLIVDKCTAILIDLNRLPNLKKLSLHRVENSTIFPLIFNSNSRLEELNIISFNALNIPEKITLLSQLKSLTLHYNSLTELPESIGHLIELTFLDLEENKLTKLPDSIGNLIKLKSLKLAQNELTKLPDNFLNLIELEELSLSYNPMEELPKNLHKLPKLQHLWLDKTNREKEAIKTILAGFPPSVHIDDEDLPF